MSLNALSAPISPIIMSEIFEEIINVDACAAENPSIFPPVLDAGLMESPASDLFDPLSFSDNSYSLSGDGATFAQGLYASWQLPPEVSFRAMDQSFLDLLQASATDLSSLRDPWSFEHNVESHSGELQHSNDTPDNHVLSTATVSPTQGPLRPGHPYSPYPSSSPVPLSRPSSRASNPSRLPSYRPRVKQVSLDEYEAAKAVLKGWKCPFCAYVQKNKRTPEFLRHRLAHCPDATPFEKYEDDLQRTCCGVPLEEAAEYGLSQDVLVDGEGRVGACWNTFSRKDALHRHLRNGQNGCVGHNIRLMDKVLPSPKPRKTHRRA